MAETHITFESENLLLEGLFKPGDSKQGVIITHPLPLYGGDMYNQVVELLVKAYQEKAYATLRFNFRGTNNSQGRYAEGVGEQQDVHAAIQELKRRGVQQVTLAGYSFGAYVNALCVANLDPDVIALVMVSPPVAFIDFGPAEKIDCLKAVIVGDQDDFAPFVQVRDMVKKWNPSARLDKIKDADHFFFNHQARLYQTILNRI